ncbi:aminoglycoside phosphotransferase family protein (plasmid) [Deinococcus sp. KNUC1210]|uniref:aminoglycoside phosphotransferase family protein n=1 Tax=Deinococcus sp. KNUC1210 TaxID=2917691 RepID=UPI001EF15ABF|nr:aminoglycoside phosphotransferase family protein [Deinococcus sp. KNUC1210]ULH18005.1 aminoglycoside phosphotransferase family protein [Deinococcus sp. KNUC1210]
MPISRPITVQPHVRTFAEHQGAAGHHWLAALPVLVPQLCREWNLEQGDVLVGGSRSYVCRVTTLDGQAAVLKVALPEASLTTQLSTLLAARGRGYVQVLAHDLSRGAMLLEALGPSAETGMRAVPEVLSRLAAALLQAWQVPLTVFPPLMDASAHKAAGLYELVSTLAGEHATAAHPAVVAQARRYAQERLAARNPRRQVVVHGDAHALNLLQVPAVRPGAESGYVFVDPEGFLCEPEYDLGVALREWNTQLLAVSDAQAEVRGWCEHLAQATGTDAEAIWQWGYLERVSTGLYLTHYGLAPLGTVFLETAQRLLVEGEG